MKTCFLFPGQGAQYPGWAWTSGSEPKVRGTLFSQASEAAGMEMKRLLSEGTAEDLKATDKAQIADDPGQPRRTAGLRERGIEPPGCAGFSLGEYAALCEAGVVRLEDLFPHREDPRGS